MRHVSFLLTTILVMAVLAVADPVLSQARPVRTEPETVRSSMLILHNRFGTNFVYDSSLDLDIPYRGRPMKDLIDRNSRSDSESLSLCLDALFKDTGIDYEIMKKYVVLTKEDMKKKPKDYTIFIAFAEGHPGRITCHCLCGTAEERHSDRPDAS